MDENPVNGLSAGAISRPTWQWGMEHGRSHKHQLDNEGRVHPWADRLHCHTRDSGGECLCLPAGVGVTRKDQKRLSVVEQRPREASEAWADAPHDLRERGVRIARLAVNAGAPRSRRVPAQTPPDTHGQHCWVRKRRNTVCQLPKGPHQCGDNELYEVLPAGIRATARTPVHAFIRQHYGKHPKGVNPAATVQLRQSPNGRGTGRKLAHVTKAGRMRPMGHEALSPVSQHKPHKDAACVA